MDWYARKPSLEPSDPQHTEEWKDSIRQVIEKLGNNEAERILLDTLAEANKNGLEIRPVSTPYLNTIHPNQRKFTYSNIILFCEMLKFLNDRICIRKFFFYTLSFQKK